MWECVPQQKTGEVTLVHTPLYPWMRHWLFFLLLVVAAVVVRIHWVIDAMAQTGEARRYICPQVQHFGTTSLRRDCLSADANI